jgi:PAS domain S-box-containing protein
MESISLGAWRSPAPEFLEQLPIAIYACDAKGHILWFNARATDLWGRVPRIGDDGELYCGSYKLYFDGRLITPEQTPTAAVLRTGVPIRGVEAQVERPDGSHVWVVVHITPVEDDEGKVIGAINCVHERATGGRLELSDVRPEEWMRARDERLAASYEHVGAGLVEVDRDGRMLRVNRQVCEITGYSAPELLGRTIFQETLLEDVDRDRQEFMRQVAGEIDRYSIEKRIFRRNGDHIWAAVTSSSIRDAAGRFLYAVRVQHDITDRKVAEGALARRRDEQTALVEFSGQLQHVSSMQQLYDVTLDTIVRALGCQRAAILLFDSAHLMRFVAWRGLSDGYRQAVEGHSPWTRDEKNPRPIYLDDIEKSDLPDALKKTIAGEGIGAVAFIPIQEGDQLVGKFMAYYNMPHGFSEPELDVALTIARQLGFSITRREAQLKLQESERRLQELLAAIPAAIYTTDAAGKVTYFNQAAVELAGRTPVLGSDEWCITWKLYNPDGTPLPLDQCPMAVALNEGRSIRNAEAVAERPDGTRVPFIPFPTPLRDTSGKVVGAINMLVDISERRQAETQQRLLLNELDHRTKNNMQMLQSLLFTAAKKAQSDEARQVLDDASGRVAAMAAAQRVLYGTTDASRFAAADFLDSVCQTVRQTLPPDVRIVCQAASGVLANDVAMPLALILNELLTNAVKHGIKDRMKEAVRVGLIEKDDAFQLYVEDDGDGFDLNVVRQRASGLQLVLGLARQLRGTFQVERTPSFRALLRFSAGGNS